MIVFSAIVPHPPLSIPGVGDRQQLGKLKKTIDAMSELRVGLENAEPDTVMIITPHGRMEKYNFVINKNRILEGSLEKLGLRETFFYKNNPALVEEILYACNINELPIHGHYDELDHGTLIPIYHLLKNINPRIVHISFSLLDFERHFEFGKLIGEIVNYMSGRVAVIASADLSHRLTENAPAGYSPSAKFFDQKVIEILLQKDLSRLMKLEKHVIAEAAECGLRSIIILLGIMNGRKYSTKILSYEFPFGVGHLAARLV